MNSKLFGILILFVLIMSSVDVANAMTATPSPAGDPTSNSVTKTPRGDNLTKTDKMEAKMQVKELKADLREQIAENKSQMREENAQKKQEYRTMVAQIKDANKKTLITRIDTKLNEINQKRTDKMAESLEKLEEILERINNAITTGAQEGLDTTAAKTAYDKAATDLETAKTAVATQAAKDYTPELDDTENFSTPVGQMFSQLQQDLQTTYRTIMQAKISMMLSARELAKLGIRNLMNKPSGTLSTTPTSIPSPSPTSTIN